MIYLPVKDNNYDYYNKITGNIFRKTPVLPPILHNINISDVNSLKNAEDLISEIDLFLYICNNKLLKEYVKTDDINKIYEFKNKLIDKINKYLLNKKLSSIKKCITCDTNIGIENQHKQCNSCYNKNWWY